MHEIYHTDIPASFDTIAAMERARLVRLCARLSGDDDAAEDLAQETLIEAWRRQDRMVDWSGYSHWLAAIARYVCLRWRRRQGREWRLRAPESTPLATPENSADEPAAAFDLEVELERHELAELLDRALALLPADARTVLIQKYVDEFPRAEIAARLGVSEGAVAMRLQRGKLAFQRVLRTTLRHEAAAYGLVNVDNNAWQETRIWCPACGHHRLVSHFDRPNNSLLARCPGCAEGPGGFFTGLAAPHLFDSISSYKPALARVMSWDHDYFRGALHAGAAPCIACEQTIRVWMALQPFARQLSGAERGVDASCACGARNWMTLPSLVRCLPEVRRFWRAHPRMHTLPEREVEAAGAPALVTRFESVPGAARIDVVSALATFAVLEIHEMPGA